jgi:hypothetical protein
MGNWQHTPRIIESRWVNARASHSRAATAAATSIDVTQNVIWSSSPVVSVQPAAGSSRVRYLMLMNTVTKRGIVTTPAATSARVWCVSTSVDQSFSTN